MLPVTLLSWDDIKFYQRSLLPIDDYSPILKILGVLWHFHGGVERDSDIAGVRN
jgi:hypothetical protein